MAKDASSKASKASKTLSGPNSCIYLPPYASICRSKYPLGISLQQLKRKGLITIKSHISHQVLSTTITSQEGSSNTESTPDVHLMHAKDRILVLRSDRLQEQPTVIFAWCCQFELPSSLGLKSALVAKAISLLPFRLFNLDLLAYFAISLRYSDCVT